MIPPEKSAAVTRGLREAFGVTEFEDVRMLTTGQSGALVYRIVVRGSPFVLRVITRTGDSTTPDHFTCMKSAADAGLAPRIRYISLEDRISITDFVKAVPFSRADALRRMPAALRTLHALPPFPGRVDQLNTSCLFLMNKGPALDRFIQMIQAANIFPRAESEELFARYAQLAAVYPHHDQDLVSSHNDLFKPDNVLFDGQRVWLVDWEAAFLNDRYADLAVVANLVAANDAEERDYLQDYFGEPPDPYQLARFFLMQQVIHMFYAMAFLWLGSSGNPIDWSETVPEFRDLHGRIWAGEVNVADKPAKALYGRVHWQQLFKNMRQARFDETLRIVADRHASR